MHLNIFLRIKTYKDLMNLYALSDSYFSEYGINQDFDKIETDTYGKVEFKGCILDKCSNVLYHIFQIKAKGKVGLLYVYPKETMITKVVDALWDNIEIIRPNLFLLYKQKTIQLGVYNKVFDTKMAYVRPMFLSTKSVLLGFEREDTTTGLFCIDLIDMTLFVPKNIEEFKEWTYYRVDRDGYDGLMDNCSVSTYIKGLEFIQKYCFEFNKYVKELIV